MRGSTDVRADQHGDAGDLQLRSDLDRLARADPQARRHEGAQDPRAAAIRAPGSSRSPSAASPSRSGAAMNTREEYDYVIVGAGSAGNTLAYRLSEDGVRVLVIEAGGSDRCPMITVPLGWGRILHRRLFDWGYFTEPEPQLDGRRVECARGRVLGGSSSINAMAYVRGHRADYDRWAAAGLDGWSYREVLPYFKRQEDWAEGPDDYRGTGGPLTTVRSTYADPLVEAFLEAGETAGHGVTHDYNGARNEGIARLQ